MLAVALIDPSDANHIEVTHPITPTVVNAPADPTELPDTDTWQQAVSSLVSQLTAQIKADAQQAVNTANAASQAANEAVSKANAASQAATNTSNKINQAVKDGDFIPQISATATQGAEGTQPSVTVTGDKATPSINFTIPKGDTGPSTVQNSGSTLNTFDVKGAGFFISQNDESVTIGNYDEWVAAGKPAWPTS